MATPAWFDYETYMANKLTQLQADEPDNNWTYDKMVAAFAVNGFVGEEGAYDHFVAYGADEDVAPNAYFNADEYYYYKAAQYYKTETPTALQVATLEQIIRAEGMNAWTHYVNHGSSEGIDPSSAFDASAYCEAKAAIMNENGSLNMITENYGVAWTATTMAQAIANAKMTVLEHYLTYRGQGEDEVLATDTYPVEGGSPIPSEGVTRYFTTSQDTFTGTAGDDTFISYADGTTATLQGFDIVDGGEGYDTVAVHGGQNLVGVFTNIEKLVLDGKLSFPTSPATNKATYDVSDFSDNVTVQNVELTGSTVITLDDVQKDVTLSNVSTSTGSERFVLNYDEGVANSTITMSKVTAQDDVKLELHGDDLENVTLVTDQTVLFQNDVFYSVDASSSTGAITATLSGSVGELSFIGGSKADSITLSSFATVTGGNGNDIFTVKAGGNIMLGMESSISTIKDFSEGDTITLNSSAKLIDSSATINEEGSLADAITTALKGNSGNTTVYQFEYQGDTYLVCAASTSFDATTDTLIRLSGTDFDLDIADTGGAISIA